MCSRYSSSRARSRDAEAALEVLADRRPRSRAGCDRYASAPAVRSTRPAATEQALEHDARIDLHRQRRRRRLPVQRVHVGAAVARIARAEQPGEVLGGHLERRKRRVLADLAARRPGRARRRREVRALGPLRRHAGQPARRTTRRGCCSTSALRQVADDDQRIAERFERLQDRRELEVSALGRRRPLPHDARRAGCRRTRRGAADRGRAAQSRVNAGTIASSNGRRSAAPMPLQHVSFEESILRDEHLTP